MKGLILAAGSGSRLYPTTLAINKQLMPIYDKPMIYYPLTTLIENGVSEVCLICNPNALSSFKNLLGSGSRFGINIIYKLQQAPRGIAESFLIADEFLDNTKKSILILGDNIFYGTKSIFEEAYSSFKGGSTVFGYRVNDPERYGVAELDESGKVLSIEEKPKKPKSNYAIPGFYIFDDKVKDVAKNLKPSKRGELEITDVIRTYLHKDALTIKKIPKGSAWLDAGTCDSFYESSSYVQAIEKRQGIKIGCPEEAGYNKAFIDDIQFEKLIQETPESNYKEYLKKVLKREE